MNSNVKSKGKKQAKVTAGATTTAKQLVYTQSVG